MKFTTLTVSGLGWALVTFAVPIYAHAAISIEEIANKAERHSAKTTAARAGIEDAQAQKELAVAWPNPELGFTYEDTGTEDESRSIQLTQRIELGGKSSQRLRLANTQYQAAETVMRQNALDARIDAVKAYYELALAELRLSEAKASSEIAGQFSQALSKKQAAGKVPPIDAMKAKLPALTAANDLKYAQRQHNLAQRKLEQLIGEKLPEEQHILPPNLPRLPSWEMVQQQLSQSPQVKLAQFRVDASAAEVGLQEAQRWPDLQFSVGMKETIETGERGGQFGISIDIPLFNRNSGGVSSAKAKLLQAQAQQQAEHRDRELLVQTLYAELTDLQERLRLYQSEILPTAEASVSAAQTGYDYGRYAFIDILDAQRILLSARSERIELWQQYLDRLAQFERELGINTSTK